MAQSVISTAILIIAAVIAVVALINAMFPTIYNMSGSVASVSTATNDRMKTDARIIGEGIDPGNAGWLHVYVKNTGKLKITAPNLNLADVYFGSGTDINKCKPAGYSKPTWEYAIQDGNGDTNWDPGETLGILIKTDNYNFKTDSQMVKIVLSSGVSCNDDFTL